MSRVENRQWRLLTGTGDDETETCNLEQILMELVCTMIQKKGATDAGDPAEVTPVSCSGFVSGMLSVPVGFAGVLMFRKDVWIVCSQSA